MPTDSKISIVQLQEFAKEVPFSEHFKPIIENVAAGYARLRAPYHEAFLRPGGTLSGPLMMSLADLAMWAAVLTQIGPVKLAVTTHLAINFLRKPPPADVIAEAHILKLGKRLAVGEIKLFSTEFSEPVAHVTSTYSIPPR